MADVPSALRGGRFVLLEPIGEGSQGRTFDGIDKREGRRVAIKRFDVRGASSWKDVELAEREARVLQSLSNPRLPAYIDHFEEDGALYLVMEKVEGESLAALRRRGAVLEEREVWHLLRDASEALDYLHGRSPPVIHRDLKPGNVIRKADGSFAFVDFGAVRDRLRPKGGSTLVGTFGFMAPEQLQGRALPASDVYAIGATALAMLTGSEPEDLPHRGLAIDVRGALGARRGTASDRLVRVLEQMLAPDPDQRASRLAPLLAEERRERRSDGPPRGESYQRERPGQSERESWRGPDEKWGDRFAARTARHAERRARRAVRRAMRATDRGERWATRGHGLPWPLRVFFMVLFAVGIVAVSVALSLILQLAGAVLRVLVPLGVGLFSIFIARNALRRAARRVERAGDAAGGGAQTSRRWLTGDTVAPPDEPTARMRVKDTPLQTRVAARDREDALDDEADEDARAQRRPR